MKAAQKSRKLGRRTRQRREKEKPNQFLIEEKTQQKQGRVYFFLSAKRWKKVKGPKTERTKDGKREPGGMERFHTEIRNGRFRRAPISQWCECRRFVPLRHYKERFTWLHISPVVVGALRMFYSAALPRLICSRMDICLFFSLLRARGRGCRAASPYC